MKVWMKSEEFSYEIEALVRAFFPEEKVELTKTEPEHGTGYIEIGQEPEKFRVFVRDIAGDEERTASYEDRCGDCNAGRSERQSKDCGDGCSDEGRGGERHDSGSTNAGRRARKDRLKRFLYSALSDYTKKTLPWGTLTGVRPTKLCMELLEQGRTIEEARMDMKRLYCCSEEKASLGTQIARRELSLLGSMDYQNGYSLYVGIPFCPTTCLYCSFPSFPISQNESFVEPYLAALYQEIDGLKGLMGDKKLTTVYIGGGTPTAISAEQLRELITRLKQAYPVKDCFEFTVEAGRPDSVTKEKLQVLKEMGVTRISINPQTMNQKTLDIIGRQHTVEEVKEAFHLARECGHDNINMDLIAGLPGESAENVRHTLEEIRLLEPDSITIHSLVTKRAANLNIYKEQYDGMEYGDVEEMLSLGAAFAEANRYEPYYLYRQKSASGSGTSQRENVGYARRGKEGLYNILIMEEKQSILALGSGASTKFVSPDGAIRRAENVKSIRDYISRIDEMIQRKIRHV